jgi:two-component system sensor histidine kinase UhpB
VVAVALAARLGQALRSLHADAVHRLHEPSAPVLRPARRPVAARLSTELAELSRVLDALHLRVRVSDEVGARRQRDAQTVGAGVFELLSGLVAAEEGARGQLSAELHDTVAQSLMLARSLLGDGTASAQDLAVLADHLEDAEEQVRAVMARTRPPALRDGDLASAVAGLRDDVAARYGLRVVTSWPGQPHPLPLASAVTLYRFFQEALLNVVKHADVDVAHLGLAVDDDASSAPSATPGPGSTRRGAAAAGQARRARPAARAGAAVRRGAAGGERTGGGHRAHAPAAPHRRGPAGRRHVRRRRDLSLVGAASAQRQRGHPGRRQAGGGAEQVAPGAEVAHQLLPVVVDLARTGVQEARTSTSLASSGSDSWPKRAETVRVTVPPAAV